MRKVKVHFKQEGKILDQFLVENKEDLQKYENKFPFKYQVVEKSFNNILNEGRKIIVHENGSYCIETESIKIIHYY